MVDRFRARSCPSTGRCPTDYLHTNTFSYCAQYTSGGGGCYCCFIRSVKWKSGEVIGGSSSFIRGRSDVAMNIDSHAFNWEAFRTFFISFASGQLMLWFWAVECAATLESLARSLSTAFLCSRKRTLNFRRVWPIYTAGQSWHGISYIPDFSPDATLSLRLHKWSFKVLPLMYTT